MANTITAANSVFLLSVAGLYPTPVQLQGFAADDAFTTEAVEMAELVMGVDGQFSAGWIPNACRQTIMIMPDSVSSAVFDNWFAAEQSGREKLQASGQIVLPSLSLKYTMPVGFLVSAPPVPSVGRVLRARPFVIAWQQVLVAPDA